MKNEIEMRLHRVMIKSNKSGIKCSYAKDCLSAENCKRCNEFYTKCTLFTDFNAESI